MQCTLDDLQQALIDQRIDIEQFVQVLVDNFGAKQTKKILKHNLKLAMQKEGIDTSNIHIHMPKIG